MDYLTLSRESGTLSGGESQRIRLASQIGSGLTGVLYVLDEPSIGLHQKDNVKLIDALKRLRDLGNTVIVVEHDTETMENADHIIDLGPEAGIDGGKIVAASDAFFPFVDGIESLVQSGVKAIIQPSGSLRDKEIIKFANETDTVLLFSRTRHFRH